MNERGKRIGSTLLLQSSHNAYVDSFMGITITAISALCQGFSLVMVRADIKWASGYDIRSVRAA